MLTCTLRPAAPADAATLCAAERAAAATPGHLVSRPDELHESAFAQSIERLAPEGLYLVAERERALVGHARAEPMALAAIRHVLRLSIVVHDGHRGQGVGTQLVRALQARAVERDPAAKIELLVRASNIGAVRLYERLGFVHEGRHVGRVRLADGTLVDDLAMAWLPTRF